jgi:hypothetical protein
MPRFAAKLPYVRNGEEAFQLPHFAQSVFVQFRRLADLSYPRRIVKNIFQPV